VVLPLALCAGALGLALVGLQALIGHFCSLCLLVDSSAVACALAAFSLRKVEWPADEGEAKGGLSMPLGAWLALSTLSVAAPAFFPLLVQTSPVPGVIRALYADKGVTVVEFFDYQCPHCRDLSPRLKKVAEQEGATLRFGYTPLPGHVFARAAARASICAAEQGKEAEVTAHFFASSIGAEKDATEAAARLVPDAQAFEQCLASARPDERIQKDTHAIQTAEFVGLPTTYIGGTRILGAQGDAMYRDAILRARQGSDTGGLKPWTYWLATVALVLAIILLGRKKAEMGAVRA
jgi:predicted DsbA family dithiol-disulfide isomerase